MIAVTVADAFLADPVADVVVLLRVDTAIESSRKPLVIKPATPSATATRCVVGLYVLKPRRVSQAEHVTDQPSTGQRQLSPRTGPHR